MDGSNGTDGKHRGPADRRHSERPRRRPHRPPLAERSELGALLSRMSALLALDGNTDIDPNTGTESEVALRLALIAMTEAEKRIERQEQRIKELESLSITDELTHVMNRRGFSMQMHRALALAARGEAMGSVIMVDLDRFKAVNDTYGHAAGDAVLQAVAECLKNRVRETDTIGRLGGDEFAVLMPGVSREIAEQRADALIRDLNGRSLHWNGVNIPIGASIGLAHYVGDEDEQSILQRADAAMYLSKFENKTPSQSR